MTPALSVVTVVKDDELGFRATRDSLARCHQSDLGEIEWIIIDSSAYPEEIAASLSDCHIAASLYWVSPEGVYEAMNAGLRKASGDYVYFLNAGDRLRNQRALKAILETIKETPVWMYGQVAFYDANGRESIPPAFDYHAEERSHFSRGRFPPHQGTVVRREALLSLGGFDTSYRITADYTAFLQLAQLSDPVETPEVLAEFSPGGLSQSRWLLAINEFHRARLEVLRPRGWSLLTEFANTAAQAVRTGLHRVATRVTR